MEPSDREDRGASWTIGSASSELRERVVLGSAKNRSGVATEWKTRKHGDSGLIETRFVVACGLFGP